MLILFLLLGALDFWQRKNLKYSLKEKFAEDVAKEVNYILDHNYLLGDIKFQTPLRDGVTLISPASPRFNPYPIGPDIPQITYWHGWGKYKTEYIGRVNLDVDTSKLPYHRTIDDILHRHADIEEHLSLVLKADVKIDHRFTASSTRNQQRRRRLTIRAIYWNPQKKLLAEDEIPNPDFLAIAEYNRIKHQQAHEERQNLIKRLLHYSVTKLNGDFPVKTIQSAFQYEASHRTVETIAKELEGRGFLLPSAGRRPRRVNPEAQDELNQFLSQELKEYLSPIDVDEG